MKQERRKNQKMYAVHNVVFRVAIVLGMVVAVVTILYFTPVPDQFFKSCDRPCHDLDWPMICRAKLVLQPHPTAFCEDCPNNDTLCAPCNQLPTIQVCKNDILVVDVVNRMPGHSVSVHWRGQPQKETPFMDGVPLVTQCPIPSYTTFQYKFRASVAGTHLWHAHSHELRDLGGLFGALIVRQPEKQEAHRKLYDVDDVHNVLVISERSGSVVVNGGRGGKFGVKRGLRYRFRVAYASAASDCPVTLRVQQHELKVIALDGHPVTSYEATSVAIAKGERLDFVLKASQPVDSYAIEVVSGCEGVSGGFGIVEYQGVKEEVRSTMAPKSERLFSTGVCEKELGRVCLGDVSTLRKIPVDLRADEVGRKIYLPFDCTSKAQTGDSFPTDEVHRMNNLTFIYPSSPLLTQLSDVNYKSLCNSLTIPDDCEGKEVCECVHIEHIPLDSTVELVLIDQGGESEEHVFHLHGYSFYVVGSRRFEDAVALEDVKELDERGELLKRNLVNPVLKDTLRVPRYGVAVVRFVANNPGFWMLRDEQSGQWTRGLDVILQVGNPGDMVVAPSKFPTCGSWIGPDFFLM